MSHAFRGLTILIVPPKSEACLEPITQALPAKGHFFWRRLQACSACVIDEMWKRMVNEREMHFVLSQVRRPFRVVREC